MIFKILKMNVFEIAVNMMSLKLIIVNNIVTYSTFILNIAGKEHDFFVQIEQRNQVELKNTITQLS